MMQKKIRNIALLAILITLIFISPPLYVLFSRLECKKYYKEVKTCPKVYVYDTIKCVLNPSHYITSLKYKNRFILYYNDLYKYYRDVDQGRIKKKIMIFGYDTTVTIPIQINFPINYMVFTKPVHLIRYIDEDSTIAEVVDFNTKCWGYVKGYVYYTNVHNNPPPKERLDYIKLEYEKEQAKRDVKNDNIYRKPSDYGLQCWGCE